MAERVRVSRTMLAIHRIEPLRRKQYPVDPILSADTSVASRYAYGARACEPVFQPVCLVVALVVVRLGTDDKRNGQ